MEMNERMARMEARFEDHILRYDRQMDSLSLLHKDNRQLIESIDNRMDRHDLQVARVGGALALIVVAANLFGPAVIHWLGL
jgi:hypothetical protein